MENKPKILWNSQTVTRNFDVNCQSFRVCNDYKIIFSSELTLELNFFFHRPKFNDYFQRIKKPIIHDCFSSEILVGWEIRRACNIYIEKKKINYVWYMVECEKSKVLKRKEGARTTEEINDFFSILRQII